jgi:hypothetical protein
LHDSSFRHVILIIHSRSKVPRIARLPQGTGSLQRWRAFVRAATPRRCGGALFANRSSSQNFEGIAIWFHQNGETLRKDHDSFVY